MTAINVIQTHDAIHFFSDGAFIDYRTGNLTATGSKVITNVAGRFAVGASGPSELLFDISAISLVSRDINEVRKNIEKYVPAFFERPENKNRRCGVVIGGFSETGERQLWKFDLDIGNQLLPLTRCDDGAWNFSPSITPQFLRDAIGDEKKAHFERGFMEGLSVSDPLETGMLALEAQRKYRFPKSALTGEESIYGVGAFAQVTTVTANNIESHIVKRWPDVVGSRISPEGAPKVNHAVFGSLSYVPRPEKVDYKSINGINAGASSNYSVDTTNGFVAPTASASTSYTNAGGTGDRTSLITVTTNAVSSGGTINNLVDGGSGTNSTDAWSFTASTAAAGLYVRFDFGTAKVINEAKWYQGSTAGQGTWKWQGSNNGSTWTDIGATFTLGGSMTQTQTSMSGNTTAYRYYQMLGVSGTISSPPWSTEIEFKIGTSTTNNMTIVTTAQTDDTSSKVRVLLEIDASASPTLNTDLTAEVTCDGGSHWALGTLTLCGAVQDGHIAVETENVSCTAGTSIAARIKTLNNMNVPIHATVLNWR